MSGCLIIPDKETAKARRELFGNSEQLDTISRQEALDALGEEPLVWTDSEGEIAERNQWRRDVAAIKAVPSAQPAEADVQKMQALEQAEIQKAYELGKLDAMEEMPHWIPCSERLPDLDEEGFSEKMLVSFSNFSGLEICEYRETDEEHGWYVGDSAENPEDVGVHVIAWMPLPDPPSAAGGETDGEA